MDLSPVLVFDAWYWDIFIRLCEIRVTIKGRSDITEDSSVILYCI